MAGTHQLEKTFLSVARWKPAVTVVQKMAWAFFLLALPVTSFPFFPPAMGGGALVRPLSIYPLIVLVGLVTLPRLLSGRLPRTVLALLPFVLLAVATIYIRTR